VRRTPDPSGASGEVYDLARDPHETRPNPPDLAADAPVLSEALASRRAALARRSAAASYGLVDHETRERLRARLRGLSSRGSPATMPNGSRALIDGVERA